jgi:hypothetical protein
MKPNKELLELAKDHIDSSGNVGLQTQSMIILGMSGSKDKKPSVILPVKSVFEKPPESFFTFLGSIRRILIGARAFVFLTPAPVRRSSITNQEKSVYLVCGKHVDGSQLLGILPTIKRRTWADFKPLEIYDLKKIDVKPEYNFLGFIAKEFFKLKLKKSKIHTVFSKIRKHISKNPNDDKEFKRIYKIKS